jgi:hypothetical protein
MPHRQAASFLREQAERVREIARTYHTGLSAKLLELASDLDRSADEMESRGATQIRD